jgi:glycosyltransferase involved in cell wall biosynthesis
MNRSDESAGDVHVLQVLFNLDVGGMENGVVNISNGLFDRGIRTSIACIDRSGVMADRLDPRIKVYELGRMANGFDYSSSRRLARLAEELKVDIMHSHNLGPLIYAASARLRLFGRVKLVHGEHGQLAGREAVPKRILQRKLAFKVCNAVHTVATGMIADLERFGLGGKKLIALPNGVDCRKFMPSKDQKAQKRKLGLPEDSFVLGSSGRFSCYKRHDVMIASFEALAREMPHLYLLIVGAGGSMEEQTLEMVRNSPFKNRIVCTGFVPNPVPYYQAMDLLVMPSLYEGLSNAMLEAMACGVTPVLHDACGVRDVIEHGTNGWVKNLEGADALLVELRRLVLDAECCNTLSINARDTVLKSWSIDSMMDRYLALFREVAGAR